LVPTDDREITSANPEPSPRQAPAEVERWQPKTLREVRVPPPGRTSEQSFAEVLDRRRSDRHLGALPQAQLFELLWHSARTRERDFGGGPEHRAVPASGGLHALDLLVIEPPDELIWRYDPVRSQLAELASAKRDELRKACRIVREGAGRGALQATLIVAAADAARYHASYQNADSLLWRDSGCLLMTVHLASTWLGLGSCLLGVLGREIVATIEDGHSLHPAGALMVGTMSPSDRAHSDSAGNTSRET
jgi:nitroreductase family protein